MRSIALDHARKARLAFPKGYEGRWSPNEMQVLQQLALTGPASGSALADYLALDETTVSKALKRFINDGLVDDASAEDRGPGQNRKRMRSLTPSGQAFVERHLDYLIDRFERWDEGRLEGASSGMHSGYDG